MLDRYADAASSALGEVAATQGQAVEAAARLVAAILEGEDLRPGEVVVVVSNSGVNAVPVQVALGCRERGLRVVALTNLEQAKATAPRHSSGARLHELAALMARYADRAGEGAP